MNQGKYLDVIIEQRFYRCSQGYYWTENAFPNAFWQRYLAVYEQVFIVARVKQVESPGSDWSRVDGDNVQFYPLPYYLGPTQFLLKFPLLILRLLKRRQLQHSAILRVPGILSWFYLWFAYPINKAFGAEVVGDPADVFSEQASDSVLRAFFQRIFVSQLKRICRTAKSISYVTEKTLQQSYPPNKNAFATHYSSINLEADQFCQRTKYQKLASRPIQLICIGNLSQPYKGCDYMLNTLKAMREQGLNVKLKWLGGGALLDSMQALTNSLGLTGQVEFLGNVAEKKTILAALDQADVFILSSRQEGLPRVLIEAMSRSLVCLATRVGGVPELLSDEFIIERDNVEQLVAALSRLTKLSDQELLSISKVNYRKALSYESSELAVRRNQMYHHLQEAN